MPADRTSGDFGRKLREARERRGISLRQIANQTKIAVSVLEALERNDISRLPGGIFGRAFVRSYAVEVGLDPEETIQAFIAQFPHDAVIAGHPASAQVQDTEALESDRRTASTFVRLIVVSLPIAVLIVMLGASGRQPRNASGPQLPAAPARADHLVVVVSANRVCRLSTTADDQKRDRLVQAGQPETFDIRRELVLTAGDAAAITMTINGAAAKPLGKAGAAVTVRVTPANFTSYLQVH